MRREFYRRLLGISDGDLAAVERHGSAPRYVLHTAWCSGLRLLANHCPVPSLRVLLFRLSGIVIGRRVQINMNTMFLDDFVPGRIVLDDEVSVAPFVSFVADSHPNNSAALEELDVRRSGPIRVGRGAWIGVGAVILPGVSIGAAAIIGANAVVTSDVPDYAIMAGVPARPIGDARNRKRVRN